MDALRLLSDFGIQPKAVIHVGASEGQERGSYVASGVEKVVFVEPIPAVFEQLQANISGIPGFSAVHALCADRTGVSATLNVASNGGQSSSMLPLGKHAEIYPDIVYTSTIEMQTTTLDDIVTRFPEIQRWNLLLIDTQGAELLVLSGAEETLSRVDAVHIEVSEVPLYEGACTLPEVVAALEPHGFKIKHLNIGRRLWGEAFFIKNEAFLGRVHQRAGSQRNLALNKPASQSSTSVYSLPDESGRAVNGVRTGRFAFHTAEEADPWWEVDLGEEADLSEIVVYNRNDCCEERASNLQILLRSTNEPWRILHEQRGIIFGGALDKSPLVVDARGQRARLVRLQLKGRTYLHLDQVEVYG